MDHLRRPWPASRRDTDSVQMNTLDADGKKDPYEAAASGKSGVTLEAEPVDVEHGHLQEIEVDVDKVLHETGIKDIEEDTSPYPEVRAVVPETDDTALPVNTLRMWILGVIWTILGAGVGCISATHLHCMLSIAGQQLLLPPLSRRSHRLSRRRASGLSHGRLSR